MLTLASLTQDFLALGLDPERCTFWVQSDVPEVCELTWQLRGQATGRQVEGARTGITINQGLFGHGSSVIVGR